MRSIIAIVGLLSSSLAFGQFVNMRFETNGDTTTVTFSGPMRYVGSAITGKPYSAEEVSEHVQTLADGTHITEPPRIAKLWRDFDGRTRTERAMMGPIRAGDLPMPTMVEIRDSVAGFVYILEDEKKVAHRFPSPTASPTPVPLPRPATPTQRAAVNSSTSERLGPETIEGVVATGSRHTRTIPVGEIGNDRPLVTTNEIWSSAELYLTVLSKYSDPRSGEQSTRLTNISRATPEAALFAPPPDYTVVDEKESFSIVVKRR